MQNIKGFSLIELLITIAIIAVLASVALPTYSGYRESTLRKAAISDIQDFRGEMERNYGANGFQYAPPNIDLVDFDDSGYSITVTYFDADGNTLDSSNPDNAQSYILSAVAESGKFMSGKGVFTLTSAGVLCFVPNTDTPLITGFGDINLNKDTAPVKCPQQF